MANCCEKLNSLGCLFDVILILTHMGSVILLNLANRVANVTYAVQFTSLLYATLIDVVVTT